jgi:hypothetical protein
LFELIDVFLIFIWSGSSSSIISGRNIIRWSSGTLYICIKQKRKKKKKLN